MNFQNFLKAIYAYLLDEPIYKIDMKTVLEIPFNGFSSTDKFLFNVALNKYCNSFYFKNFHKVGKPQISNVKIIMANTSFNTNLRKFICFTIDGKRVAISANNIPVLENYSDLTDKDFKLKWLDVTKIQAYITLNNKADDNYISKFELKLSYRKVSRFYKKFKENFSTFCDRYLHLLASIGR